MPPVIGPLLDQRRCIPDIKPSTFEESQRIILDLHQRLVTSHLYEQANITACKKLEADVAQLKEEYEAHVKQIRKEHKDNVEHLMAGYRDHAEQAKGEHSAHVKQMKEQLGSAVQDRDDHRDKARRCQAQLLSTSVQTGVARENLMAWVKLTQHLAARAVVRLAGDVYHTSPESIITQTVQAYRESHGVDIEMRYRALTVLAALDAICVGGEDHGETDQKVLGGLVENLGSRVVEECVA
jgi:spore coat polysaccharide biosynthesis protein SpsF (cytidylyltransferase family)